MQNRELLRSKTAMT